VFESAFNGSIYFAYDADHRYLAKKDTKIPELNRGQPGINPLIAPFMFLSKHSDDCPLCGLSLSDIVQTGASNTYILPESKSVGGALRLSLPGLPFRGQATIWNIIVGETDTDFAPQIISKVSSGLHEQSTHKLLNYTNIGDYKFPTRIETMFEANPNTPQASVVSTGLTTILMLRVLDHVDASTFEIGNDDASVVWNWNQAKFEKTNAALGVAIAKHKAWTPVVIIMMGLISFVGAVLLSRLLRRRTE
jgi:hypothetical protein